ncbi:hypothetical protein [Beggiatoa leptomitoformis]|uniref:Uncharacterized protein n=1 Tax=Beggiatoa leptomitoformis TaxID=288004 RepID=A0A2N9YG55_9GAMM|nr:hypothetical protein [Beggiatoa leptomitoformis]AUI69186.2 hypothetical protein BLE401_11080 [Beggiatoa leptomitoformis]QGX03750.1 hypothetical protein AL038_13185 [Beggiatoa leptomitoformis]
MKKLILSALLLLCSSTSYATILMLSPNIQLVPSPPDRYVVSAGEGLASVAARFVVNPNLAMQFWQQSIYLSDGQLPQVHTGDIVSLIKQEELFGLQIKQGRDVKLLPAERALIKENKPPVLPTEMIQQFLNRPRIVTDDELEKAGHILGNANKTLLASTGTKIYVRGLDEMDAEEGNEYAIIRLGDELRNPENDELLAHEAIYLGDAKLVQEGDPATLLITHSQREIQDDNLILPMSENSYNQDFVLSSPAELEDGKIISLVDGVSQIGQYQIVVINKGEDDGIEIGHILQVRHSGGFKEDKGESIKMPSEPAGTLMVFKVFERVSYAVVTNATLAIQLYDEVTIP